MQLMYLYAIDVSIPSDNEASEGAALDFDVRWGVKHNQRISHLGWRTTQGQGATRHAQDATNRNRSGRNILYLYGMASIYDFPLSARVLLRHCLKIFRRKRHLITFRNSPFAQPLDNSSTGFAELRMRSKNGRRRRFAVRSDPPRRLMRKR